MTRKRGARAVVWIAWVVLAGGAATPMAPAGHTQQHCDVLVPVQEEVELFSKSIGEKPAITRSKDLGHIVCLGEQNGRYHIHSAKGNGWVPTWELEKSGPKDPLQPLQAPSKSFAAPVAQEPSRSAGSSSIAVSPSPRSDTAGASPRSIQSPTMEGLLHQGVEAPAGESPSKSTPH
jgi:hypothetical protein